MPEAGDKAHQMRYGSMMSVGSLFPLFMNSVVRRALWATGLLAASWSTAWAGAQIEEPLADSVRSALSAAVGRGEPPKLVFADEAQRQQCARWTQAQEARLRKRKPEELVRHEFLNTVCYEAKRAGLEPSLVLGLIQVESGFRKHAISHAGARGYMQIMPFWSRTIGGVEMAGRTYKNVGMLWTEYYGEMPTGGWLAIKISGVDIDPGTEGDTILNSVTFG